MLFSCQDIAFHKSYLSNLCQFPLFGTYGEIPSKPNDDNHTNGGGYIMKCPKCKGRMFAEKFYDFVRSFDAWKCTCCGELLDPTIVANRARNNNLFLG